MSFTAVVQHIRDLLDGTAMPFPSAALAAYLTPPDPNVESHIPTLYVLEADGPEKRLVLPRNTGPRTSAGKKETRHSIRLHVIWFLGTANPGAPGSSDPDLLFAGVISTVMAALRTCEAPALITDPQTGEQTQLVDTGENMSYQYLPRHAVKNQRMLRYDALITLPLLEVTEA